MPTASYFAFDEISSDVFAFDTIKNSKDMGGDPTSSPVLSMPEILQSIDGRGKIFGDNIGLVGEEAVNGALRLTRDCTVMARVSYETEAVADGAIGMLVARGTSGSIAERVLFGVEFVRVNAATLRVRARWEEIGGADVAGDGAEFVMAPGKVFSIAVSRTWIDTTTVELLYVVNGEIAGSETILSGDIGEGDGGTLTIGCAGDGAGNYDRFLPAGSVIESLSIESDAMCVEEMRQVHRRIAVHEPNGYRILRAYLPPGEAWSRDPESNVQKWIAAEGQTLGQATARAAALRDDYLPDRAYGENLAHWEMILKLPVIPGATIQQRRNAVIAKRRSVLGSNPDDMRTALAPLYGQEAADIEILEFTGLREDDFSFDDITPDEPSNLWRTFGNVSISANTCFCRVDGTIGDEQWGTGKPSYREASIGSQVGEAIGATIVVDYEAEDADVDNDILVGLMMRNPRGDAFFFGAMNLGGGFELCHFSVVGGVTSPIVELAGDDGPGRIYLRYNGGGTYAMGEVPGGVPNELAAEVAGPSDIRWCGFGCFSTYKYSDPQDGLFSNAQIFEPSSTRGFSFFAYRDSALAGSYNLQRAQEQIAKQSHLHSHGVAMDNPKGIALSSTGRLGIDPLMPRTDIEPTLPVGPPPIASLDFGAPVTVNDFSSPSSYEADYWDFQFQTVAGNYDNGVGAATLNSVSGLTAQKAVGVFDGLSFTGYNAWESVTATDGLIASGIAAGNSDEEDFSFRVVLRIGEVGAGSLSIIGKLAGGGVPGWLLYVSDSAIRFYIADGTTSRELVFPSTAIRQELADGAIHSLSGWYDHSAGMLYLKGDLFSQVSLDVSAVTGTLSNAQALRIGQSHLSTLAGMQCLFAGVTVGIDAQSFYDEAISLPGEDPTGELFIVDRNSIVSIPVNAAGNIAHFAQDSVAIGYDDGPGKIALAVNDAVQNLVSDSETLGNWTGIGASTVDKNADAPDGFRNATKITASGDNGFIGTGLVTVASTEYTESVYVWNADSGNTSGRIVFYDESNGAEVGSQAFTTNASFQRVTLTATSVVGQISSSFLIEIDGAGDSIHAWGAQCELGAYATFYVRALGAASTSVRTRYTANFIVDKVFGEIVSISTKTAVRGNVALWNCVSDVGNQNRRRVVSNPVNNTSTIYAGNGAIEDSVVFAHGGTLGEETIRVAWDQSVDGALLGGKESVVVYQGATFSVSASPWENPTDTGSDISKIDIGSIGGGFVQPGWYQSIKSYSVLSKPLP